MGEKNRTTPRGRDAETGELNPADEAQKRRRTTELDEIHDGTPDEHEDGDHRRLLGKRHS